MTAPRTGAVGLDFVFPPLRIEIADELWPLVSPFRIARGAKTEAHVLVVSLEGAACRGLGEAVPYARFGETMAEAKSALHALAPHLARGLSHEAALRLLPAGAALNALDAALLRLRAALTGEDIAQMLALPDFTPVPTAVTLSLDGPDAMADAARRFRTLPLLKLKLGDAALDATRIAAVREAAPSSRLIIDANEGWDFDALTRLAPVAADCGVALIEQPLPAGADTALAGHAFPVPLCADESLHGTVGLASLADRYGAVNIKLDKAGGLVAARRLAVEAEALGLRIMLGSMVATSLSMAMALRLAPLAQWVDLDSPLLLARDRPGGLRIENGVIVEPGLF